LLTSLGHLPQDSDVASALAAVGAGTWPSGFLASLGEPRDERRVRLTPSPFLNRFPLVLPSLFFFFFAVQRPAI
jgi:hypothetical protein